MDSLLQKSVLSSGSLHYIFRSAIDFFDNQLDSLPNPPTTIPAIATSPPTQAPAAIAPAVVIAPVAIALSKDLDFSLIVDGMRPARSGNTGKPIELVAMIRPSDIMRMQIVLYAKTLGYCTAKTKDEKAEIAEAASRIILYDNGFRKEPKGAMVQSWMEQLDEARHSSDCLVTFSNLLKSKQLGPKQGKYTEQLEKDHPGYLHAMFCKAGKNIGFDATWQELADEMNDQSKEEEISEGKPPLKMSRHHICIWFEANKGKVRKQWERPLSTKDKKTQQI